MKKIFTLSVLVLTTLSLSAQLPVSTQPSLKNALIEEFTGLNCVYCPDGHKIAAQIVANNPNRAFAVNIHTGGFATPQAGQPDFRTPDGNAIANMPGMGITGYPQGAVSRHLFSGSAMAMSRSAWNASVNTMLSQNAYVNVAGDATLDVSANTLTVDIEAYYTANSPASVNKLTVMLLQNNINAHQTGGATYNPSMVNPDGTYRHMHALRDVLTTGATGEDITPTTQGTLITRTINYTIPATIGTIPVDISNLEVLVFVAEGVTEIINVAHVPITVTGLTTVNNALVQNVVAEDQICVTSIAPKFQLKNMGSAAITSANISYSINGGTAQVHNWTGSLSSLATTDIILPAISFTLNPTNTLDINVTDVNGVADDDPSNNTGSTNFSQTTASSPTINLLLNVVQDRYGDEITWKFFDAFGNVMTQGGPYQQLSANGTLLHSHNIYLPSTGCYRFVIYDSYGDGINAGYGAGSVTLKDGYGANIYFSNGTYGAQAARNFDVTGNVNTGIEENSFVNNISIYPNPVQTKSVVEFNLVEANTVTVKVLNAVGQVVLANEMGKLASGNHSVSVDATSLSNGLYFVELEVGNSTISRKISVNK